MKKNGIIIISIIVIALIVWWVVSSTVEINKDIEKSYNSETSTVEESAQAENLHIVETESGKKIWELTADKAVYSHKNAKLTNIKGKFFGEDNKVLLTFEAPEGNYIEKEHKLSLNKGAFIQEPNEKISIHSETMYWTKENDNITAEGNVKVIKANFITSYADKTIFSTDFNNIKLEGNTFSELNMSG
ncbi:MAG: LPS export ABC transporter periplasmic protein LptC [Cyanobacteriota bacterium]